MNESTGSFLIRGLISTIALGVGAALGFYSVIPLLFDSYLVTLIFAGFGFHVLTVVTGMVVQRAFIHDRLPSEADYWASLAIVVAVPSVLMVWIINMPLAGWNWVGAVVVWLVVVFTNLLFSDVI